MSSAVGNIMETTAEDAVKTAAEDAAKTAAEDAAKKAAMAAAGGAVALSALQRKNLQDKYNECVIQCLPSNWDEFTENNKVKLDYRSTDPKVYPNGTALDGITREKNMVCPKSIDGDKCEKYCKKVCKQKYDSSDNLLESAVTNATGVVADSAVDGVKSSLSSIFGNNWLIYIIIFISMLVGLFLLSKF